MLPALALGNFYVLSADLTRSIAQNISAAIIPVGTLEDLSVAVWMRQQQVGRCAYAYCVSVCMYVCSQEFLILGPCLEYENIYVVCVYVCVYIYMCVYVCVCLCMCMYVCMCVCSSVCVCPSASGEKKWEKLNYNIGNYSIEIH